MEGVWSSREAGSPSINECAYLSPECFRLPNSPVPCYVSIQCGVPSIHKMNIIPYLDYFSVDKYGQTDESPPPKFDEFPKHSSFSLNLSYCQEHMKGVQPARLYRVYDRAERIPECSLHTRESATYGDRIAFYPNDLCLEYKFLPQTPDVVQYNWWRHCHAKQPVIWGYIPISKTVVNYKLAEELKLDILSRGWERFSSMNIYVPVVRIHPLKQWQKEACVLDQPDFLEVRAKEKYDNGAITGELNK